MRQGEERRGKRRREKEGKMGRREINVKRRGRRENEGGNEIGKREKTKTIFTKLCTYIWYIGTHIIDKSSFSGGYKEEEEEGGERQAYVRRCRGENARGNKTNLMYTGHWEGKRKGTRGDGTPNEAGEEDNHTLTVPEEQWRE